ncbi:MAG: PEP-CTERM sorting domain-containing protein [Chthoniobacterales bacterium]|nr:PEP-CTERM sorting domain-containing protein [Chthoniobacterales bacterium]
MKKILLSSLVTAAFAVSSSFAIQGTTSPYSDPAGDIGVGINTGTGTLDILGMEVSNNATDITFTLTVNGNITDVNWGKFMIGIATGGTGTTTGNGWNRPINLSSPIGGMDYWIGSWVDSSGGSELYSYGATSWNAPSTPAGFSLAAGASSTISYTLTLSSLGLAPDDVFYFDAYSSGGGDGDSAVDALANPNVSITNWAGPYTSSTTGTGGVGLNSYQVVPEPTTYALLALGALGMAGYAARRRARK